MQNHLASVYIFQIGFEIEFTFDIYTPNRRQSKTLLTTDEYGSKIARNSGGDKWQSKHFLLTIFDLLSSIVLTFSNAPIVEEPGFKNVKNKHLGLSHF